MENEAHSGSRWEPGHERDQTAEPAAGQALPSTPPARKRNRPVAALTAAGLVLIGGAGGWAIGSAAASSDTPAVDQPGTGTRDGGPGFGGPGGMPDDDDGFGPRDGSFGDDGGTADGDPA